MSTFESVPQERGGVLSQFHINGGTVLATVALRGFLQFYVAFLFFMVSVFLFFFRSVFETGSPVCQAGLELAM